MTSIGFCQNGMGWSWEQIRDFWVEAEKLGFENGTMMDNNIYTGPPDDTVIPTHETWTSLAAIAEATSKIRIGPQVTPCARRAPSLFAKMVTQVDHISNGRVYVGMGVGDLPKYNLPWGMPFPKKISERSDILREEIEIMRLMWSREASTFMGKHYHIDGAQMVPKPLQKEGIPIYMGLSFGTKIMPRIAAELCDGVLIYNGSDQATKDLLEVIKGHCEAVGRDYDSFYKGMTVSVHLLENEDDRDYMDWPVDHVYPSLPIGAPSPEEARKWGQVSLEEQLKFLKSFWAAGELADEVNLNLPEGIVPPLPGYNVAGAANRFIIGTVDQVRRDLKAVLEIGIDELYIQGLDSMEHLRIFGREILPDLQG